MTRNNTGEYDSIKCHECKKIYSRNKMTSKEVKSKNGTSMVGFFCKKCL